MPENPFFVGGPVPPDRFVGRTAESNEAYDQIANQSHLALWGSPGMGKSSLLRYLAECPEAWQKRRLDPTKAIIVSLHCTALHPFTPPKFWRGVLSLLREECAAEP
ncbi:MAG: ATP-binding protein, partial [Promethearchaeota archaeon]